MRAPEAPRVYPRHSLVALALLAAPVAAWAEKPQVLILPYQALNKGVTPELAEQSTVVVAQEMGSAGVSVARADDVADSVAAPKAAKDAPKNAPSGDAGAGAQAQELIAAGKQSIDDQSPGPAIDKLKKAVRLLDANGDAVADIRIIADAYLYLAIAHFLDGDEDAADEALGLAVHYAPARKLEESEYPNLFIRVYDRARFNVLRRPRGTVEVKAAAGSQVLFDGKNVGKAPLNITEVLPGNHWVRVEKAGETPQVKRLLVRSKATILVEFDGSGGGAPSDDAPVGVLGAIAKNELDKSQIEQIRAAGKRAGATWVMAGAIFRTETAYNIYTALISVSDGAVGRAQDIAFDLDMLSAQIEVFNLVADLKKQVKSGALRDPVTDTPFKFAPKLDLKPKVKAVVAAKEAKVQTVVGAPAPIEQPKEPSGEAGAVASRGPMGKGAAEPSEGAAPKPPSAVPKDEEGKKPAFTAAAVVPRDEAGDDDEGSTWWIWLIAGIAVAGAAGAGTALLVTGGSSTEGTLRITW